MPRFKPGQSGNPRGRPPGSGAAALLRRAIEKDLPDVLGAVVAAAKDGDIAAAKLLLDRVLPTLKPLYAPLDGVGGKTLSERGESVLGALMAGFISPDQADQALAAVGKQARVLEIDDLLRRVESLEDSLRAD